MASTNKTTHYELSQYVGTDKPTYLTDYNGDMSAIDTGIYNAQTKADSAYTLADTANGNAGTAQTTANSAVTSAGTANTNIGTMANLETTDKTSLVNAINENKRNIDNFNLTNFTTFSYDNITSDTGSVFSASSLSVATNSDGSLAKIYGQVLIQNATASSANITISTSLRPSSELTITGNVLAYTVDNVYFGSMTIKTNGDVVITGGINTGASINKFFVWNSLLFIKDFGDTPTPQN